MKVIILEACDGFSILIKEDEEVVSRKWFSQEDDKTGLMDVFNQLGFEAEYEEDY